MVISKKKCNVCHITSAHRKEDDRIYLKECVSLANSGYETYLVQRGNSYKKNGVNIIGFGNASPSRLKRMFKDTRRAYKIALELNCDIYHIHDPELLPYALKLKRKGKTVIFDSHEIYSEHIKAKKYLHGASYIISKIYNFYESFVLKRIDAVISVCTVNGKDYFKGKCPNTCIIRNLPILEEFYEHFNNNLEKSNNVCYVGGLTEIRGIKNDIIASSRCNVNLILAGEFDSNEFKDLVQSMPEYSCVDYRGFVDRNEVRKIISECKVGLATMLNKGDYWKTDSYGIKVYEYMSMGVPVIRQNSEFDIKMMEKYKFGLCVDPENVDEIARAIKYIIENPDEARKMGENGRKAIREEFNWQIEKEKLIKLYSKLI